MTIAAAELYAANVKRLEEEHIRALREGREVDAARLATQRVIAIDQLNEAQGTLFTPGEVDFARTAVWFDQPGASTCEHGVSAAAECYACLQNGDINTFREALRGQVWDDGGDVFSRDEARRVWQAYSRSMGATWMRVSPTMTREGAIESYRTGRERLRYEEKAALLEAESKTRSAALENEKTRSSLSLPAAMVNQRSALERKVQQLGALDAPTPATMERFQQQVYAELAREAQQRTAPLRPAARGELTLGILAAAAAQAYAQEKEIPSLMMRPLPRGRADPAPAPAAPAVPLNPVRGYFDD